MRVDQGSTSGPQVTVVVPAYLKANQVRDSVLELHEVLKRNHIDHEIIVVVDGSPDETEAAARSTGITQVFVESYAVNKGKGYALKYGSRMARGNLIAFADADPDLNPEALIGLITDLYSSQAVGVIGSKVHPDSKVNYPRMRRIQSSAYRQLNRVLFGLRVTDTQTGLKVFQRGPLLQAMESSQVDRFAFDLELLVLLHDLGADVREGPVELSYAFNSSVPLHGAIKVLRDTFGIAWRRKMSRNTKSSPSPESPHRRLR